MTSADIHPDVRVTTVAALQAYIGRELGVSDWLPITQDRIDAFAAATGQGGAVAPGTLILSLITLLRRGLRGVRVELEARMGINYGSDRVRFSTPVRAGSRIRVRVVLLALHPVAPAIWQAKYRHTIEIEDEPSPALVAETLNRIYLDAPVTRHNDSGTGRL